MEPFKNKVTPEQYANAKRHWEILISEMLPGDFDMSSYTDNSYYIDLTEKNKCGTCACSAGWLPYTLNIPVKELPIDGEIPQIDYIQIMEKKLGITCYDTSLNNPEFDWCFSMYWAMYSDNSQKGAGIRMRILYEEGLPKNWRAQMYGEDELQYQHEL